MKSLLTFILFLLIANPVFPRLPESAAVKKINGNPTLFVNNKPVTPDFYALTHAYGGRWSWEEVPQRNLHDFCIQGFRLYQVDLYFEDIWHRNSDSLDMDLVRRQVHGVLDVCPEAGVVIRVHVNAPYWWNEMHGDECMQYADGPVDQQKYGPPFSNEDGDVDRPLRASLASDLWKKEAGEKLVEF